MRQPMQERRDRPLVAEWSPESQALLVATLGEIAIAGQVGGAAVHANCPCSERHRQLGLAVEQLAQPSLPFVRRGRDPEVLERDRELERELDIRAGRPVEGGAHVVPLGQSQGNLERLVFLLRQVRRTCDCEHPLGVSPARRVERPPSPSRRSAANARIVSSIQKRSSPRPSGTAPEQALVEQRRERVEVGVADRLGRLERAARREHREAREELLLRGIEQVVRPGDGRPQGGVALLGVARPLEQVEPLRRVARGAARERSASSGRLRARAQAAGGRAGAHSSPTAGVAVRSGRTACARSTNSVTASSSASGGRSNSVSPWIRSGSREVTSRRSAGAAPPARKEAALPRAAGARGCRAEGACACPRPRRRGMRALRSEWPACRRSPGGRARCRESARTATNRVAPSASSASSRASSMREARLAGSARADDRQHARDRARARARRRRRARARGRGSASPASAAPRSRACAAAGTSPGPSWCSRVAPSKSFSRCRPRSRERLASRGGPRSRARRRSGRRGRARPTRAPRWTSTPT